MPYDETAYPQDRGTGLDDTVDYIDAAPVAFSIHDPNAAGYVREGFSFTPDWTNDLLNVSGGAANLYQATAQSIDHTADCGTPAQTFNGCTFPVQKGPSGDMTLQSGDNHVFIGLDQTENNKVDYYMNTTDTAPPEPYLKLGTANPDTETAVEMNRFPVERVSRDVVLP